MRRPASPIHPRNSRKNLGNTHASLVVADGLVYSLSDAGVATVFRPGPSYQAVARNDVAEKCFASPAISRGQVFLRSDRHVFCIGPRP